VLDFQVEVIGLCVARGRHIFVFGGGSGDKAPRIRMLSGWTASVGQPGTEWDSEWAQRRGRKIHDLAASAF